MLALPAPLAASGKRPGRPAVAERRSCLAATCLTEKEYDGLIHLSRVDGVSISDLMRDLISEAIIARQLRLGRSASA